MLADLTISRNIIDFAGTLRHRFYQAPAENEELQRQDTPDDEDDLDEDDFDGRIQT